jgi:GSH-dependent disulfide-bond oxidoreductase
MYDLYTWSTPNGRKISIMLEELAVPYIVHPVNIDKGEQFTPEFMKLSPNQKIPAIIDRDKNLSIFESGAILMYLADKHGGFFPAGGEPRLRTIEWLMWQMSAVGPFLGRAHYFLKNNPGKAPFAEAWFAKEAQRIYGVLNRQLDGRSFITGEYSIADIACFPWIARHSWHRVDLNDYSEVKDWYLRIASRPAVIKGYNVPDPENRIPMPQ